MSKTYEVNKLSFPVLALCIGVYLLANILANLNMGVSIDPLYRALDLNFSPISFYGNIIPLVLIYIGYKLIAPYWFTSFKNWYLIRKNRSALREQLLSLLKYTIVYTVISWIITVIVLQVFMPVHFINPYKGVFSYLNNYLADFLLLLITIIYNYGLVLLPLIVAFLVKNNWQVLVISIVINFFLPILLFMLRILPENLMPINLMYEFVDGVGATTNYEFLTLGILAIVIIEVTIIIAIYNYKESSEF